MSKANKENTTKTKQVDKGINAPSNKPPPAKRPLSEVSPNTSVEEIMVINHQLEGLSDDVKNIRESLKNILNKDEMKSFIDSTIKGIVEEIDKNIEHTVSIKVEEKTKKVTERLRQIEEENSSLKKELLMLKSEMKTQNAKIEDCLTRSKTSISMSNYNEQYSRKNNLKIMDLPEKPDETEDDLIKAATTLFRKEDIELNPSKIVAIHRIPGKPGHTKPVLMKLSNNNEKAKVMRQRKAFKAMGHRLVDDVTKMNAELIRRLISHDDIDQAWYYNGSVYGRTSQGNRHKFDIFDDIRKVIKQ